MEKNSKMFPLNSKDYKLYEEVGEGVSATVYRALCIPLNEVVAIKVMDLERCSSDLDVVRQEVQTMTLINHPNLLKAHCSFTSGRSLWIVMPYMSGGSCLHIMKSSHQGGFEQPVIATLLYEVLKALVYLHAHGHIHRDVKAGNILVDSKGAVKLADFGVSASLFDHGHRQLSRNTFVGTPCWMAPEVMQQLHGYDFKADIWSFGITALELAHGNAPFSKYPPMKILMMTLQNAPPRLDHEKDKRFSKSFKEIVAACLVKDPKKRPTSQNLLRHRFFKHVYSNEMVPQLLLDSLAPLGDRFRMLKENEADFLVKTKSLNGNKELLSQREYIRGISAWNFDLEDLKKQASLMSSNDPGSNTCKQELERLDSSDSVEYTPLKEDGSDTPQNDDLLYPLQAVQSDIDVCDDDANTYSSDKEGAITPALEQPLNSSLMEDTEPKSFGGDCLEQSSFLPRDVTSKCSNPLNGSVPSKKDLSPAGGVSDNKYSDQAVYLQERAVSKPLSENALDQPSVQCKGHMKAAPSDVKNQTSRSTSVLSSLHNILQHNSMQREELMRLIKHVNQIMDNRTEFLEAAGHKEHVQVQVSLASSTRERELQSQVMHMQQSIGRLVEEVQIQKLKNAQLERNLGALLDKEKD